MRLLALLLCLVGGVLCAAPAKQPNIVFIFSDDHAYQAISAYGDARKLNQTPNIDRLAKEGMRFDRALVTNSICGPSRAVILTGERMLDAVLLLRIADRLFDFLQGNAVIRPQGPDRESFDEVRETDAFAPVIRDAAAAHRLGEIRAEKPAAQGRRRHPGITRRLGNAIDAESLGGCLEGGDHVLGLSDANPEKRGGQVELPGAVEGCAWISVCG